MIENCAYLKIYNDKAANTCLVQANRHIKAGDYLQAKSILEEALSFAPGKIELVYAYGMLLYHLGELEAAIKVFKCLSDIMPNSADIRINLSHFLFAVGRIREAEHEARKALCLEPNNQAALMAAGRSIFSIDKSDWSLTARRPVCLLLRYKFVPGSPFGQRSHEELILTESFREAGYGTLVEYYLDQYFDFGHTCPEQALLELVREIKPDILFVSSYDHTAGRRHPHFSVLQSIRLLEQIPLVVFWWDTCGDNVRQKYGPIITSDVDLHVLMDSTSFAKHFPGPNFLRLLPPAVPQLFKPDAQQDIFVSFMGSTTGHRSGRAEYLAYLQRRKVPIISAGGQVGSTTLSWDEYASMIRRSKISLNFSESIDDERQVKARVLEAICSGSLLLETENPETAMFFEPMKEYIPCYSPEDMYNKIIYFLEHENERQQIALNGYKKAKIHYNSKVFWASILKRLRNYKCAH